MKFFSHPENPYPIKHVIAPRGSLILWDSRTVHWNQYPSENRASPKVRMVGYQLYLPKTRLTDEARALRKESFERCISSTGAIPTSYADLRYSKNHINPGFERYLEDPNYIPPKVNLTPLNEPLLSL